ncbi:hypothetical protein [Pseudonocardia charpentierae]|uniref:Uncharacterized protein n=1 Tax=Pseudonocardia charpentierae TaxID=3075545 RepID=A0ABU2NF73_9PSEU|nr:hypothetical protein [Pseudonocardia sp. DSM 45834]MDT0352612.1 hypothetical protein [Pseudonocardia sp. DSM 45834]
MVSELALLPSDRTLRRWNRTAAVYMLASPAVDAAVGWPLWSLAELHPSLPEAADALTLTAGAVAVAIALLPTLPLIVVYLPLRAASAREVTTLQQKLAGPVDALLVEHVAHAALSRVAYSELRQVSDRPWQDGEQGRHRPLGAAELKRLGLGPSAGWADTGPGSELDRG